MKIRNKFQGRTGIFFLLAILPAIFTGLLINTYSVNIPYWDQWAIAPLFEKVHNGSLVFSDLIAQHNESRKFFPRLLFIGLAFLTGWDVRYEMLIIFLLACIVSFNLYRLSSLTIEGSLIKRLSIAAISNLLVFAPIQWENWLWGIQIVVFVPITCITTCILIAYSQLSTKVKFFLSVCLCTLSTFSYANGILSWVIVFPVLFIKSQENFRKKIWLILCWMFAFIINILTYFYNYQKPPHHPNFSESIVNPIYTIKYFLTFLGSPLGLGNSTTSLIISPLIGLALILVLLASCIYCLKSFKNLSLLHRIVGWLTIAMYTFISAIVTTSGRVGFGVEQALSSRYTTFSVYLIVSLIYIVVIIYDDIQNKASSSKDEKLIYSCISFFAGIILVLHLLTSVQAIVTMNDLKKDRLLAKSCLQFINILPDDCLTKNVFPKLDHLSKYANTLNTLGFLTPPLVKNNLIEEVNKNNQLNQENYGWFDNITKNEDGSYIATGWAVLPDKGKPADSVILTYEVAEDKFKMFSLVNDVKFERVDVAKNFNKNAYLKSGWQKSFLFSDNNISGSLKLIAWGFDANTGKYFKLNGSHIIQR